MAKKKMYVATMYRWGDRECHSYVLGVWNKKTPAIKAVDKEIEYRGGKYFGEILEFNNDSSIRDGEAKVIYDLMRHPEFRR